MLLCSITNLNNNHGKDYTTVELHNIIRLATVVWGVDYKNPIADMIGDKLRYRLDGTVNALVGDRRGATDANPMYFMVQESVESYVLGCSRHIRGGSLP